jgi:Domain of unknown function (DUF4331)
MRRSLNKKLSLVALGVTLALALTLTPPPPIVASDHADSPVNASDQATDLADTYVFLDPNDNTKLVIIATVHGFIVPGEAVNFAFFDPMVRFVFELETTGDARPDQFILIQFSPRTSTTTPQTATVVMPFGQTFTAPTTVPTLAATPNAFTVTTDSATGVSFFAGETDDPFFFDIPGFSRFRSSVLAGSPDVTQLNRGRDSFAGYNILSIALSIPISLLNLQRQPGNPSANIVGVDTLAQRQRNLVFTRDGLSATGGFRTLDRDGNPAMNALIIPFARKDEYNMATTLDDAQGRFAGDIVAALQALGTNATNIGVLASVYVTNGDFVRLNLNNPNTGTGGGTNSAAAFPNGRRLGDDVVDTFLFLVSNGGITKGDNVNSNDVTFGNTFPFLAPPQQPRASGVIDDNTRN